MGVLKVRDPATGDWVAVDTIGTRGPVGWVGPTGPAGPTGADPAPSGLVEEVLRDRALDPATGYTVDVWYDTDETSPLGSPVTVPTGGTTKQAVVKASNTNQDIVWGGPHLPLTGGDVTGNLSAPNVTARVSLTTPIVRGNVHFNNSITAAQVEDRTAYPWESYDIVPHLYYDWATWNGDNGNTSLEHGSSYLHRNRYGVTLAMCVRKVDNRNANVWMDLFSTAMPANFRPPFDMYDSRLTVQDWETGPPFEVKLLTNGLCKVMVKGQGTAPWTEWEAFPIHFTYPLAVSQ